MTDHDLWLEFEPKQPQDDPRDYDAELKDENL